MVQEVIYKLCLFPLDYKYDQVGISVTVHVHIFALAFVFLMFWVMQFLFC